MVKFARVLVTYVKNLPLWFHVQLAQKILNGIYSQVSSRIHEARKPFKSASNKQIKTYSFRRMLSFRGSLRGPGARRSNSGTSAATAASYATGDSASSSPGLQPQHRLIKLRPSSLNTNVLWYANIPESWFSGRSEL